MFNEMQEMLERAAMAMLTGRTDELAEAMSVDVAAISVKGKTNEKVGALGRNEAIAVHAVALLSLSPQP